MPERPSGTSAAGRLLRQRLEMGLSHLFLEGASPGELIELARRAASVTKSDPAAERSAGTRAGAGAAGGPEGARAGASVPERSTSGRSRSGSRSAEAPVGATIDLPVLPDDYDAVRRIALDCTRCRLAEGRTQVVFSDGRPDARVMVVGEAPGAHEDETGLPFVGAAGKYLDLLLATVGLSRADSVYICNVLKCRPPGNRNPQPDEIEACSPFLRKQIALVGPEALLAVGSFSGKLLTGRHGSSLGKLRGEVHAYEGVPLVVTYHPAALLRNPNWTRPFWDDLQLLRTVLDGSV